MKRTRVKICGITRPEDALTAVTFGADAIGMVFHPPSPRCVSIEQAQAISQCIPPFVQVVGLFVNAQESHIRDLTNQVRIDLLQFHGDEDETDCLRFHKPYIKAIRVKPDTSIASSVAQFPSASGILLDTYVQNIPGGTGRVFDWSLIPQDINKPLILAGGLNPDNIHQAITATGVYAVDVSGGVEASYGIKDLAKIQAFMQGVTSDETR